jgi:hypothetical protein
MYKVKLPNLVQYDMEIEFTHVCARDFPSPYVNVAIKVPTYSKDSKVCIEIEDRSNCVEAKTICIKLFIFIRLLVKIHTDFEILDDTNIKR